MARHRGGGSLNHQVKKPNNSPITYRIVCGMLLKNCPFEPVDRHAAYDSLELNRRWALLWELNLRREPAKEDWT